MFSTWADCGNIATTSLSFLSCHVMLNLRDDKVWRLVVMRSKCAPQSLSVSSSGRAGGGRRKFWGKCEEDEWLIYFGSFFWFWPFFWTIFSWVGTRVVKAPFFKANLKAVSKRLIKAVKRLLYVVNMMNDCFKMHYMSVHLVVSNCHHDKTIEPWSKAQICL